MVRSVVAERDLIPVMSHFHIGGGRIQGTNGKLTLDAPWPEFPGKETINVPAEPLVKAFEKMAEPSLELKGDHLIVREGKMRVRIPLSLDAYPHCQRPSEWSDVDDALLASMRKVRSFVSEDASRPWACGVLIRGGWIYATNNIVMVRRRFPSNLEVSIPGFAIDQLVRCAKKIEAIHIRSTAVAFKLEGDVWMESARYADQWPDIEKMFEKYDGMELTVLRGNEHAIVEKILPFVPDKRHPVIRFGDNKISTLNGEMEAEIEWTCDVTANFHAVPLLQVLEIATHWLPQEYPKAVPFSAMNDDIEGMIAGVRI